MKRAIIAIVVGVIMAAQSAQAQATVSPIASPLYAARKSIAAVKPVAPDYARLYWRWLTTHDR